LFERLARLFVGWVVAKSKAAKRLPIPIVTFAGQALFERYEFFRRDEWPDSWWDDHRSAYPKRPNALPWWLPFNVFVHKWHPEPGFEEDFHDHPRWSVTICLVGRIVERTPWGNRTLKPGSIVFRSRKAIHGFALDPAYDGEVWTLFVVGRRKYRQNTYIVTAR
jgi:hypothetical protein